MKFSNFSLLNSIDPTVIYCNDGDLKVNEIINMFTSNRCPTLTGKPKIFFIQACQGKKSLSWKFSNICSILGESFDSGTLVTDSVETRSDSNSFLIPTFSDLLIYYSTYPGIFLVLLLCSHLKMYFLLCRIFRMAKCLLRLLVCAGPLYHIERTCRRAWFSNNVHSY